VAEHGAIDPDVDLHVPEQRGGTRREQLPVLAVVAAGGALGACARYGLALWLAPRPGAFPWATFVTNLSGCLLIGVLMVLVTEVWTAHRLARPFLGTGILGGYTTFSTAMVDVRQMALAGHEGAALGYMMSTVTAAVAAAFAGVTLTRAAAALWLRRRARRREHA
jgi:CrcB protein